MKSLFTSIFLTFAGLVLHAQPGQVDVSFNRFDSGFGMGEGAKGTQVATAALQADGKLIIGGWFVSYNGVKVSGIARLLENGALDPSFKCGTGVGDGGQLNSIVIQPDGKILIAGSFSTYNDSTRQYLTRLNADGTLDKTFQVSTGLNGSVLDIVLLRDGKIIIGGSFSKYGGKIRRGIARLLSNGALDATFDSPGMNTGVFNNVSAIAVQADGKILVGGNFVAFDGKREDLARLQTDGSLDESFVSDVSAYGDVLAIAMQPDGYILVGGLFPLKRLRPDGTNDASFMLKYNSGYRMQSTFDVQLQADGRILACGGGFVGLFDKTGTQDAAFKVNIESGQYLRTAIMRANGRVVAGGSVTKINSIERGLVSQLLPDGSNDFDFNPMRGANNTIYTMVLQPDGKILIGGALTEYNGRPVGNVARLFSNGELDTTFYAGTGGSNGAVKSLAVQEDGKILVGGDFFTFSNTDHKQLVRLQADGSIDESFHMWYNSSYSLNAIKCLPTGKILIGSFFGYADSGPVDESVKLLNEDGSEDEGWNIGGLDGAVRDIALQDGKLLIAGDFTLLRASVHETYDVGGIARLNMNGSIDNSFTTAQSDASILKIALQTDNKIVAVGGFFSFRNQDHRHIVRLLANGDIDETFKAGTGANATIYSVALQPDGKIVIAGEFTEFNGRNVNHIIRLQADGSLDDTFEVGAGTNAVPYTLLMQNDRMLLMGGAFTAYNNIGKNRLIRLDMKGRMPQTISFDPISDVVAGIDYLRLDASSSSGLPVTYEASASVTMNGNDVVIARPGKIVITAMQEGNEDYSPAEPIARTFCANPQQPVIKRDLSHPGSPILTSSSDEGNQWFLNGESLETGHDKTLTVGAQGTYTLQVTIDGCVSRMSESVRQLDCTDLKQPVITTKIAEPDSVVLVSSSDVGNQWFLNGTPILEATDKELSVFQSGVYTLQVTDDGCVSPFSENYTFIVTSVEDPQQFDSPLLYPNPVSDEFAIANVPRSAYLTIADMQGRTLQTSILTGEGQTIDVRSLPVGLYVVSWDGPMGKYYVRFMKN